MKQDQLSLLDAHLSLITDTGDDVGFVYVAETPHMPFAANIGKTTYSNASKRLADKGTPNLSYSAKYHCDETTLEWLEKALHVYYADLRIPGPRREWFTFEDDPGELDELRHTLPLPVWSEYRRRRGEPVPDFHLAGFVQEQILLSLLAKVSPGDYRQLHRSAWSIIQERYADLEGFIEITTLGEDEVTATRRGAVLMETLDALRDQRTAS